MSVVSEDKKRTERGQIFHLDSSELRQRTDCSQ